MRAPSSQRGTRAKPCGGGRWGRAAVSLRAWHAQVCGVERCMCVGVWGVYVVVGGQGKWCAV